MQAADMLNKVLEEQKKPVKTVASGSMIEGIVGLGAAVLAILALVGVLPALMLSIAVIAFGVALVIESSAVMGRFSALLRDAGEKVEFGISSGGASMEGIAGIGGIALGILALLGFAPVLLTSIAIIAYGAAVVIGSGAIALINSLVTTAQYRSHAIQNVANTMTAASADIRMLAGLGALTMGILALLGIIPTLLSTISILALGSVLFLETLSFSSSFAGVLRR